jgi:hypothetical protein
MITLYNLNKVEQALKELTPDVETFAWGPSYELAKQRKEDALRIVRAEIKRLKENK